MLSNQSLKDLKGKAHKLNPVVYIGNKGLSDGVFNEIDIAIKAHELIKIKIAGVEKNERVDLINEIIQVTKSELVQTIGSIAVIYKKNLNKDATKKQVAKKLIKRHRD